MSVKVQLKHSATKGKVPLATDLVNGELALNINSESPAAYIKDSAGNVIQLAGLTGSETAPATPTTGQVWVDSSQTPNVINVWNGASWIPQTGSTVSGTTAPTSPATGQIWVDTNTTPNVVKIWDGTAWVVATPTGSDAQAIANDAKYATKDELNAEDLWDKAGTDISPKTDGDGIVLKDGTGTASVDLNAGTSGSPLVRDSSGRLGLGTSAPARNCEIVGGTSGGEAILLQLRSNFATDNTASVLRFGNSTGPDTNTGSCEIVGVRGATGSTLKFRTQQGSGLTDKLTIDPSGKVGIGTQAPTSLLDVRGSGTAQAAIKSTGGNAQVYVEATSGNTAGLNLTQAGTSSYTITHTGADDALAFAKDSSEKARIDSSGRLLVGTTTSTLDGAALQVNGDFSQKSLYQQKVASFTGSDVTTKTLNIVTNNASFYSTSLVELSCAFDRAVSSRGYFYKALFTIEEQPASVSSLTDETASGVTAAISFSGQTASIVFTFGLAVRNGTALIKVTNSSGAQYISSMSWS